MKEESVGSCDEQNCGATILKKPGGRVWFEKREALQTNYDFDAKRQNTSQETMYKLRRRNRTTKDRFNE